MTSKLNLNYLFLQLGLYEPFPFDETSGSELERLIIYSSETLQFDCYCLECNKDSTFKFYNNRGVIKYGIHSRPDNVIHRLNAYTSPIDVIYRCQRDESHVYSFMFRFINNELTKIGQFPSIADIELHKIHKYRTLLKKDYNDFSKAIGLFSHGVGAGSFVYLRRIFENLIEESRELALQENSLDDEKYKQSRMDEKILLLKDYLPPILVENRQVYSILSKGIHELPEEVCLDLFPKVELAIELILDEKLAEKEKQNKVQQLKQFISSTVEKLK